MQRHHFICAHCGAEQSASPWERSPLPVPYTDSASPLSSTERDALPSLWAAKDTEGSRLVDSPQPSNASSFSPATPHHKQSSSWSPVHRGSQDKSERQDVSTDTTVAPGSISRSLAASPDNTTAGLGSIEEDPQHPALPGTMSAKTVGRTSSHRRPRSSEGDRSSTTNRQSQSALTERVRATLKELFKKHPVDESTLEHIDHHHWAEDD